MRHLATGQVEITSQNHNFAVDVDGLDVADVTHVNLNDGVVEGIRCRDVPAFSVQYHPEAGPGPHDARYLFDEFRRLMMGEGRGSLMPRRTDLETILIIGSGPIVIGQACEFDYSGTQACRVLRSEGYRIVLANSNPATIMTDPEFADRTYIEPLTPEVLTKIIERERPDAVLPDARRPDRAEPRHGARRAGVVGNRGERSVELIGANAEAIATAEDRERFKQAMIEIGLVGAAVGHGPLARRGDGRRRAHRAPRHRPARVHPRWARHRHRVDADGVRARSPPPASTRARSARSSSSARSSAGRSSSSR